MSVYTHAADCHRLVLTLARCLDVPFNVTGGKHAPLYAGTPIWESTVMERTSRNLRKETHTGTAMRFGVIPGGASRQCIHITAVADADMLPVPKDRRACSPHSLVTP